MRTRRLIIERVRQHNVTGLKPLLKYQSLFHRAGIVTIGKVDLVTLNVLAQTEKLLQIREKGQGTPIGLIVLLHSYGETGNILANQYEVGYLLLPQEQHQGYMTEALDAICGELTRFHIKVVAEVERSNVSSMRVLKRCNFVRVTRGRVIERWQH